MRVNVRLTAHLKRYAPAGSDDFWMELDDGTTLGELVDRLGIPAGVERVIVVNGRPLENETRLKEGDVVTFLAVMTGG
ncbi:MAG: MoaD/ThiS family protein [Thermodesulfobacteriota bacterium]